MPTKPLNKDFVLVFGRLTLLKGLFFLLHNKLIWTEIHVFNDLQFFIGFERNNKIE